MMEDQDFVNCVVCENPMVYVKFPIKYYCSGKCRIASHRAIHSTLSPRHHASRIIRNKLLRWVDWLTQDDVYVEDLTRQSLLELHWLQGIFGDLVIRLRGSERVREFLVGYDAYYADDYEGSLLSRIERNLLR